MNDCTWELHYELPPGDEWSELLQQVQSLKDELGPLRMDFFDDNPKISIMVGDIEALCQVLVTLASERWLPKSQSVEISVPHSVCRLKAILDEEDAPRWEELEP